MSEQREKTLWSHKDLIDKATFEQILEMDEEDEEDFSREIVYDFCAQAEKTFEEMDEALAEKDLEKLSSLGHFLKGSSATLGLTKVKDNCEKIQHLGARKDETGLNDESDDAVSLKKLRSTIKQTKVDFEEVTKILKAYYGDS